MDFFLVHLGFCPINSMADVFFFKAALPHNSVFYLEWMLTSTLDAKASLFLKGNNVNDKEQNPKDK